MQWCKKLSSKTKVVGNKRVSLSCDEMMGNLKSIFEATTGKATGMNVGQTREEEERVDKFQAERETVADTPGSKT